MDHLGTTPPANLPCKHFFFYVPRQKAANFGGKPGVSGIEVFFDGFYVQYMLYPKRQAITSDLK